MLPLKFFITFLKISFFRYFVAKKNSYMWYVGAGFVVIAVILIFLISGSKPNYTDFAKCLSANEITMYGTYNCGHCNDQKEMFGKAFVYVDYVECDPSGFNAQPEVCKEKKIRGYPSWEVNEKILPGKMPMEALSSMSGCELPR